MKEFIYITINLVSHDDPSPTQKKSSGERKSLDATLALGETTASPAQHNINIAVGEINLHFPTLKS